LYKVLTRHFYKFKSNQYVALYDVYHNLKVKIIYTKKKHVRDLECELIDRYKPSDNRQLCSLFNLDEVPF